MKKALFLMLAALIFAASLASCAVSPTTSAIIANVRVTSSDALDAAEWLAARLGDSLTDRVVIGTDASAYGVDVSALEDDGYVIRNIDGEIALFAKSATGLDIAARKYAKAVEAGERIADETFHEGYRIEELRLAGIDVSEYAIAIEGDNAYHRDYVKKSFAGTFISLIETACGAKLTFDDTAAHKIVFREIVDPNFKESSYHYFFEDGDLIFEYADLGGARNAMIKFLENECGWNDLYYGMDVLKEADLIDVPAGVDVICHPRFGGLRMTTLSQIGAYNTIGKTEAFTYKYRIPSAHHYLGAVWAKDYGGSSTGHMPCLTDEYVFEDTVAELCEYSATQMKSAKIGEGFDYINLGMEDSNYWCMCKECIKVAKEENYSWAGPMVRFANAIDDALDDAGYGGLKFSIFAYAGSNPPPKTAPHDDVYVTFVCDGYCTHHTLNGEQCSTGKCLSVRNINGSTNSGNNKQEAEWISGWGKLTDHLYVRPAPLLAPLHSYTIIDQTYDDIKFLSDCGVDCIYSEIYTSDEFDTNLIVTELWEAMMFDPDMTRAEFGEEAARLFEKYYGDGWQSVLDYVDCLEETETSNKGCWSVWNSYAFLSDPTQNNHAVYRELWDRMLTSLAAAQYAVNSREQDIRVKKLEISAIYGGCYASYYFAYEDFDDARIAMLEERWAKMLELLKDIGLYDAFHYGISPYGLEPHYPKEGFLLYDTVEETAWIGAWETSFYSDRAVMLERGGYQMSRAMPEKYVKGGE